jgi:hypothetical protein
MAHIGDGAGERGLGCRALCAEEAVHRGWDVLWCSWEKVMCVRLGDGVCLWVPVPGRPWACAWAGVIYPTLSHVRTTTGTWNVCSKHIEAESECWI